MKTTTTPTANASTGKRPPLTAAERQRRHRAKRKAELMALRQAGPDAARDRLQREVIGLRAQLALLERKAAQQALRIAGQSLPAEAAAQAQLATVRLSLRALIPRLPLAARHLARTQLQQAGLLAWLDTDSAAGAAPEAGHGSDF